jgi:hypothetical protein
MRAFRHLGRRRGGTVRPTVRIIEDHEGEAAASGLGGSGKMRRFRLLACGARRTWGPPKAATRFARFRSASGTAGETADRCEAETHDLSGGLGGAGRLRLPAV